MIIELHIVQQRRIYTPAPNSTEVCAHLRLENNCALHPRPRSSLNNKCKPYAEILFPGCIFNTLNGVCEAELSIMEIYNVQAVENCDEVSVK